MITSHGKITRKPRKDQTRPSCKLWTKINKKTTASYLNYPFRTVTNLTSTFHIRGEPKQLLLTPYPTPN